MPASVARGRSCGHFLTGRPSPTWPDNMAAGRSSPRPPHTARPPDAETGREVGRSQRGHLAPVRTAVGSSPALAPGSALLAPGLLEMATLPPTSRPGSALSWPQVLHRPRPLFRALLATCPPSWLPLFLTLVVSGGLLWMETRLGPRNLTSAACFAFVAHSPLVILCSRSAQGKRGW